jgi:hypothetical protein
MAADHENVCRKSQGKVINYPGYRTGAHRDLRLYAHVAQQFFDLPSRAVHQLELGIPRWFSDMDDQQRRPNLRREFRGPAENALSMWPRINRAGDLAKTKRTLGAVSAKWTPVQTGQSESRSTVATTEPKRSCRNGPCPCVAITIRSTPSAPASSTILLPGSPLRPSASPSVP